MFDRFREFFRRKRPKANTHRPMHVLVIGDSRIQLHMWARDYCVGIPMRGGSDVILCVTGTFHLVLHSEVLDRTMGQEYSAAFFLGARVPQTERIVQSRIRRY